MALTDQEFQLGEVRFQVRKLLPMESYRVLETIRGSLGSIAKAGLADNADQWQLGATIISGLPPDTVEQVRQVLFGEVLFTCPEQTSPVRLAGSEELAFKGLEPVHVYEVLARAFTVNFQGSWDALSSLLPFLDRLIPQSPLGT